MRTITSASGSRRIICWPRSANTFRGATSILARTTTWTVTNVRRSIGRSIPIARGSSLPLLRKSPEYDSAKSGAFDAGIHGLRLVCRFRRAAVYRGRHPLRHPRRFPRSRIGAGRGPVAQNGYRHGCLAGAKRRAQHSGRLRLLSAPVLQELERERLPEAVGGGRSRRSQ